MSSPNYPEQPYDPNATAQAPISPPGNNTTTNDAKLHAQEKAQQAQQQAQEKAQMAQEKARQLGNQMANHPAVQQAQASAAEYHARADKALSQYPAMNKLEQRTGVPKTYLAAGGVGLMFLLISVNALAAPASNLVGWGLPAYMSMRAIETPSGRDDVQWLTYWVIFGFLTYLESFALRIVLYYVPWYFALKTVFVLWLQLPQFKGAATMYHAAIRPSMDRARLQATSPTTRYPATTNTQNAPAGYNVGNERVY
ncbi:TB2/DP1, HVA22 family [Rhizoctonia solani]|uniref:Protein YOP1 n=3 Tax=Rhizoctonia solani TaxID=456999 RepID=A0A8H7LIR4_9AGAM|nr:TB2/DP1, HVA22 family [Rhizoctonia solani]